MIDFGFPLFRSEGQGARQFLHQAHELLDRNLGAAAQQHELPILGMQLRQRDNLLRAPLQPGAGDRQEVTYLVVVSRPLIDQSQMRRRRREGA